MTWTSYHNRGAILREVIAVAEARRDGVLPTDVAGAAERFDDDLDLLGALQLRWHTRLSGRIERHLGDQPMDLEEAVVTAWCETAREMPGVRAVLDCAPARSNEERTVVAMRTAQAKERQMLAVMAGRGGVGDPQATAVGARIEDRARATLRVPTAVGEPSSERVCLLDRLRAVLAAA